MVGALLFRPQPTAPAGAHPAAGSEPRAAGVRTMLLRPTGPSRCVACDLPYRPPPIPASEEPGESQPPSGIPSCGFQGNEDGPAVGEATKFVSSKPARSVFDASSRIPCGAKAPDVPPAATSTTAASPEPVCDGLSSGTNTGSGAPRHSPSSASWDTAGKKPDTSKLALDVLGARREAFAGCSLLLPRSCAVPSPQSPAPPSNPCTGGRSVTGIGLGIGGSADGAQAEVGPRRQLLLPHSVAEGPCPEFEDPVAAGQVAFRDPPPGELRNEGSLATSRNEDDTPRTLR